MNLIATWRVIGLGYESNSVTEASVTLLIQPL